jgi:hypothetical protein
MDLYGARKKAENSIKIFEERNKNIIDHLPSLLQIVLPSKGFPSIEEI